VEEKATQISMETALPQALSYMAAHPNGETPMFGLLYTVLRILKKLNIHC